MLGYRLLPTKLPLGYLRTYSGDFDDVKEYVRRLLHDHEAAPTDHKPRPEWLYSSPSKATLRKDIDIVQFLFKEKVAGEDLLGDKAVRSRAFKILELFLRYRWDINKLMG